MHWIYDDMLEYMHTCDSLNVGTSRFYLNPNYRSSHPRDFLSKQHMGKNNFNNYVWKECDAEGIAGSGVQDWVINHSLLGTVLSALCRRAHAESLIKMRTEHKANKPILNFQNLLSEEGRAQQADIFGGKIEQRDLKRVQSALESTSGETEISNDVVKPRNVPEVNLTRQIKPAMHPSFSHILSNVQTISYSSLSLPINMPSDFWQYPKGEEKDNDNNS